MKKRHQSQEKWTSASTTTLSFWWTFRWPCISKIGPGSLSSLSSWDRIIASNRSNIPVSFMILNGHFISWTVKETTNQILTVSKKEFSRFYVHLFTNFRRKKNLFFFIFCAKYNFPFLIFELKIKDLELEFFTKKISFFFCENEVYFQPTLQFRGKTDKWQLTGLLQTSNWGL